MRLVDPALPAATHLTGPGAIDVLRVPVESSGGEILSARPVHVQYRPGSDVVVRYSAQVSWRGEPARRETLAATSTIHGVPDDVVLVTATTGSGPMEVGVWRWPYDPVLRGLGDAVTPSRAAAVVGLATGATADLDVVAYRPTDRAVIRVSHDAGRRYIKVVAPAAVESLARRHEALNSAGVPAPRVVDVDTGRGLLILDELSGPTLREVIKSGSCAFPPTSAFDELADAFAASGLDTAALPSRLNDAALHARMLTAVLPECGDRLERLIERFDHADRPAADTTVHGDLHEGQIIVDGSRITGVLDIDDAGPGAPIDDRANLIARLTFRASTDPVVGPVAQFHADRLTTDSETHFAPDELALHTAAALTGLATGPFRIQSDGWRTTVAGLLAVAEHLAEDERTLSERSSASHRQARMMPPAHDGISDDPPPRKVPST